MQTPGKQPLLFSPEVNVTSGWGQTIAAGLLVIAAGVVGALIQTWRQSVMERQRQLAESRRERYQLLQDDVARRRAALDSLSTVHGYFMEVSLNFYQDLVQAKRNHAGVEQYNELSVRLNSLRSALTGRVSVALSRITYDIQDDYVSYMQGMFRLIDTLNSSITALFNGASLESVSQTYNEEVAAFMKHEYGTLARTLSAAIDIRDRELTEMLESDQVPIAR